MKWLLILPTILSLYAGQSIVTTSSIYAQNAGVPNMGHSTPVRIEFEVHNWTPTTTGFAFLSHAFGGYAQFSGTGYLQFTSYWDTYANAYNIPLTGVGGLSTVPMLYVRIQRDPVTMTESVEAWDYVGFRVYNAQNTGLTNYPDTDPGLMVGAAIVDTAFFRVHNTLVPLNGIPPLNSGGTNSVLWWKFDNNLNDSAGSNPASMVGGVASYVSTPYQVPQAILKTANFPLWGNTASIRTGVTTALSGAYSFTQADSSLVLTCAWSQLSGPSTLTFDLTNTCTPNISNVIWGDYYLQLVVTDINANTSTATAHIGAVTTDANWVITDPDPNVAKTLGPMIAFGHNPWGYEDERALYATTARAAAYVSMGISPVPTWKVNLPGTITYKFGGNSDLNGTGTILTSGITAGSTTINVTSVANIDLTALPTQIVLASSYGGGVYETVRIDSHVGTALHVLARGSNAQSWGIGTQVMQLKVSGSGTNFTATLCNPGNSTWVPSLHYLHANGGDAIMNWILSPQNYGCEGDTALYLIPTHDIPAVNGTTFTGVNYAYANVPGYVGAYGVDFYGEEIAHYALWKRSGLNSARDAARVMAGQYVSSPYLSGGDGLGLSPLLYGGGVIGAEISAIIDSGYASWDDIEAFANNGYVVADITSPSGGCNYFDTRDSSYVLAILALAAGYDTNPTRKAKWLSGVQTSWTRENICKQSDNSWSNAGYKWGSSQYPAMTVTLNNANVTGSGFTSNMCYRTASGTLTVTHNSASVTGSGFISGNKIAISGLSGGVPFYAWYRFQVNSPSSITLGVAWPGDSGTATYIVENNDNLIAIGTSVDDAQLQKNWSCTYNSSTSITLNRPWDGPSGTVYMYQSNLPGFSQQPYMMGIKVKQLTWASQVDLTHDWNSLLTLASTWLQNTGYDPITGGLFYGRVLQACEPATTPPISPTFDARTPGCNNGLVPGYISAARTLIAEGSSYLVPYYNINLNLTTKGLLDTVYGNLWGYAPFTTGGVYTSSIQGDSLSDTSLASYKWTGFHFGMGMAHQWPAARLTGSIPPSVGVSNVVIRGKVKVSGRVVIH